MCVSVWVCAFWKQHIRLHARMHNFPMISETCVIFIFLSLIGALRNCAREHVLICIQGYDECLFVALVKGNTGGTVKYDFIQNIRLLSDSRVYCSGPSGYLKSVKESEVWASSHAFRDTLNAKNVWVAPLTCVCRWAGMVTTLSSKLVKENISE